MPDLPALQQYLQSRHVDCPTCGYDLCDLQTDRCPECGGTIELIVAPQRPLVRRSYDLIMVLGGVYLGVGVLLAIILFTGGPKPPGALLNIVYAGCAMPAIAIIVYATAHKIATLTIARHVQIIAVLATILVIWFVVFRSVLS